MNKQEMFERYWSEAHDMPLESLAAHRHATKDGYRLPSMASHYRTFCAALQGLPEIDLPPMREEPISSGDDLKADGEAASWNIWVGYKLAHAECREAIEAAGLKARP